MMPVDGPWVLLIMMLNGGGFEPLASIGATILILALAFDPFVQKVLRFPVRNVNHPRARTARASQSPVRPTTFRSVERLPPESHQTALNDKFCVLRVTASGQGFGLWVGVANAKTRLQRSLWTAICKRLCRDRSTPILAAH